MTWGKIMTRKYASRRLVGPAVISLLMALSSLAYGDGTEQLGPPSISIAGGSGIEVAGVGIEAADGSTMDAATVNLPLEAGQTPVQVLAYWEGNFPAGAVRPDTFDLLIEGSPATGQLIGGLTNGLGTRFATYRADVTGLALGAGVNAIDFEGFAGVPGFRGNGAGILVVYDDGTAAEVGLADGNDRAYFASPAPEDTTAPVAYSFAPAAVDRVAVLSLFFSDVRGIRSGGGFRPTSIVVTVDGGPEQEFNNLLDSVDGAEWDTVVLLIDVPAGAAGLTVQALSEDRVGDPETGAPASFSWIAAGFDIDTPTTGGGEGCTPGYWRQRHHYADWTAPYDPSDLFSSVFEDAFPGMTLGQVVRIRGGGLNALGRHTVAALLNAASAEVSYDLTPAEVIAAFNAAYPGNRASYNALKDDFESFNELGCPLNNSDGSNFTSAGDEQTLVAKKVKKAKKGNQGKSWERGRRNRR